MRALVHRYAAALAGGAPARLSQSYTLPGMLTVEETLVNREAMTGPLERLDRTGEWRPCFCELSAGSLVVLCLAVQAGSATMLSVVPVFLRVRSLRGLRGCAAALLLGNRCFALT